MPWDGSTFYLIPAWSSLLLLCFSAAPSLRQKEPKLNVSWITAGGEGQGVTGNPLETQASPSQLCVRLSMAFSPGGYTCWVSFSMSDFPSKGRTTLEGP